MVLTDKEAVHCPRGHVGLRPWAVRCRLSGTQLADRQDRKVLPGERAREASAHLRALALGAAEEPVRDHVLIAAMIAIMN